MNEFTEVLQLIFLFLVVGGTIAGSTWLLWVAGVQGWAFYRERMAQATIVEADAARATADVTLVRPDINGMLPVHRAAVEQSTNAILALLADRIDALRLPQPVPTTITYSPTFAPHQAYRNDVNANGAEIPALPMLQPPADFWSLYHQNALPNNGFLMGYSLDDGHPILADWKKLYSALIGGQSGSGKSTLVRCILAQSALQGGRFVVIDPHQGSGDESLAESLAPLHQLMLCEPAGNDNQIRDALKFVANVAQRRLAGQDTDRNPLILIVDELTGILARGNVKDDLLDVLGLISQESRKVGVYAMGIGQQFQAQLFPTTVRNAFVSFLSCRARRDTAKVMSGSNEFGRMAEGLTTGQAVWMTPQGEVNRLAVPNTTAHHIELVARQIDGAYQVDDYAASPTASPTANSGPRLLQHDPARDDDCSSECSTDSSTVGSVNLHLSLDSARVQRVRAAIRSGMSKTEILKDVWGVDMKKGGGKVTAASHEYDEIVRALVGGNV